MSKFDYDIFCFWDDNVFLTNYIAVSKRLYTKEQAIEIAKAEFSSELCENEKCLLAINSGFVRYGYGLDANDERQNNWWLEAKPKRNSCPCWAFHIANSSAEKSAFDDATEYIPINREDKNEYKYI